MSRPRRTEPTTFRTGPARPRRWVPHVRPSCRIPFLVAPPRRPEPFRRRPSTPRSVRPTDPCRAHVAIWRPYTEGRHRDFTGDAGTPDAGIALPGMLLTVGLGRLYSPSNVAAYQYIPPHLRGGGGRALPPAPHRGARHRQADDLDAPGAARPA